MTPGARIKAAIELVAEIGAGLQPADTILDSYFRGRRYIGARDRRAVSTRVYGVLRRRARLEWHIGRVGSGRLKGPRALLIADMVLGDAAGVDEVAGCFNGSRHCPEALDADERALAAGLVGRSLDSPDMPRWVRLEYPDWLETHLAALGEPAVETEMTALNIPAALDLRVNTLKGDRNAALAALAAEGVEGRPTPLSPLGIRVDGRTRLGGTIAFKNGLVEVQDEGSQIVSLLTDARPGMTVVDFCAGAGGKTLALAAAMQGKGRLIACDTSARRLKRMEGRLARAGVRAVERRVLSSEQDRWIGSQQGTADRVLLDVPCSGSGTWRRAPEAKWRLTPFELDEMIAVQRRVLASAARLVAPGGRLVYATCSILPAEDETQVDWFLASGPGFAPLPLADLWARTVGGPCPTNGPYLRLGPAVHGTDGFFCAVLERRA
jgi:16S rRNA (cytosine967-C5)-methyltransferase